MSDRLKNAFVVMCLWLLGTQAHAQNIAAGQKIAQTWCGSCHGVEPDKQGRVFDVAPSFAAIAGMKSTTSASLAVFLSMPHTNMPNYSLSRQEIRDVSAYILSLRPFQKDTQPIEIEQRFQRTPWAAIERDAARSAP